MTFKFRVPGYFNRAIHEEMGELYVSTAIADLAIALVLLFEPIYLYSVLGYSVQEVLLFFAAVYAIYVVALPFGAKIISRFGYSHGILFSIPFQIAYWFLLFGAKDVPTLIYFAPLALVIEKALFWPSFHAIVSRFANRGQIGREFSGLYAIISLMNIAGPLIGGLIAQRYGLGSAFIVASVIYLCSFIPLFWNKEIFTSKKYRFHDTWEMYKLYPMKFLGYFGFGEELLVLTVWPIFIYLVVKNYQDAGMVVTIATLVAMFLALYIGKITDRHSKIALIRSGSFIYALVWIARLIVSTSFGAFIVDALSRTSKDLVFIPMSAVTYERAESTDILPYIVGFEQSLAMGKFLAAVLGIIIFTMTGSFAALFIMAGVFSLLYMLI